MREYGQVGSDHGNGTRGSVGLFWVITQRVVVISYLFSVPSGPGSVIGIATGYGLDGLGIESRWGRDFPHLSRPALGTIQLPVQWIPGLSWG